MPETLSEWRNLELIKSYLATGQGSFSIFFICSMTEKVYPMGPFSIKLLPQPFYERQLVKQQGLHFLRRKKNFLAFRDCTRAILNRVSLARRRFSSPAAAAAAKSITENGERNRVFGQMSRFVGSFIL